VWAGVWWYDVWRPAEYIDFAAGDRVRVTGFLGNHNGKVFINDRHSDDPLIRFTVEIIGHPGLPDPQLIPSVANCNHFLQDRADGGERYQTRWTMIHGVEVTSGSWANDSDVVIADDTGSVGLKLSQMGDFDGNTPPADRISFVGIFDQEDLQSPFHDTYRIWVKKQEDTAAALDSCREVSTCGDGDRAALVNKTVSRVYNGCFYIQDADRSSGVRIESSRLVSVGDVVHVLGSVSTVNGEKAINPSYLTVDGSGPVEPVFVNGRVLRGEGGLDVFGLLARCVGTLGEDLGGAVYEFVDEEGQVIALDSNGAAMPPEGSTVSVTGVVRYGSSGPVILLSGAEGIQVLQ